MSIYFNEHGSAIGYQVEGRWLIKGDYLQIDQGPNIPEGLYKINDNKVKFPFDYKEVTQRNSPSPFVASNTK